MRAESSVAPEPHRPAVDPPMALPIRVVNRAKDLAYRLTPDWVFRRKIEAQILADAAAFVDRVGTARACNLCGNTFADLAPFNRRPGRMCPRCFSLERHRLLKLYLDRARPPLSEVRSLLHFAPERCLADTFAAVPGLRYATADLMTQFIPVIEATPEYRMSITEIQFPDDSFDALVALHVLEHVPDDRAALREIHRVLRPGGRALLQVPLNRRDGSTLEDRSLGRHDRRAQYGAADHLRLYGRADLDDRLRAAGFGVAHFTIGDVDAGPAERLALIDSDVVFVATKPAAPTP